MIQTKSGDEQELKSFIEQVLPSDLKADFFVPIYENVWRSGGRGHISLNLLFPGYLFAETDMPERLFMLLKGVPKFTRLLNMENGEEERTFLAVSKQDEDFLTSLMDEDHVIRVTYIHRTQNGRIDRLLGPLSRYEKYITRLDVPHRRAIVETHIFGKDRRIKFGLWTDADPDTPRLRRLKMKALPEEHKPVQDIGIYVGDKVRDKSEIYKDMELIVSEVDAERHTVRVTVELFGTKVRIEMDSDQVEVVEER